MSKYLTAKELADKLRVTVATVHAWHRRGKLPCLRVGRRPVLFDPQAVDDVLRQHVADENGVPHDD